MKGETLVITGGTGGIGCSVLHRFAKAGCHIAFTYHSQADKARGIAKEIKDKYKVKVKAYPFFVSNAVISGRAVAGGFAPFMRLKYKGLARIYISTVISFTIGVQEAAKRLEKVGGGAILTLSSLGNRGYMENYAGHGSAKAALEVMVKYAAVELGPKNIRVNALSASAVDTKAFQLFPNYKQAKEAFIRATPMNRLCTPEDLAGAAFFLCSDESLWISGQTIIADGSFSFNFNLAKK